MKCAAKQFVILFAVLCSFVHLQLSQAFNLPTTILIPTQTPTQTPTCRIPLRRCTPSPFSSRYGINASLSSLCRIGMVSSSTPQQEAVKDPPTSSNKNENIITTTATTAATTATTNNNNNDIWMENWYKKNGIICPNIKLQTTKKSIGGRGLFYSNIDIDINIDIHNDEDNFNLPVQQARQGDIIAFIPQELVFEISNLRPEITDLDELFSTNYHSDDNGNGNNNNNDNKEATPPSWPTILTTFAYKIMQESENDTNHSSNTPRHLWKEWIELWKGGGPEGPRPSESYTNEEIQTIIQMIKGDDYILNNNDNNNNNSDIDDEEASSIETRIREVIDKRYNTYKRDLTSVKHFINGNNNNNNNDDDNCSGVDKEELFASLWSIVLSRTASLGPQWKSRGIIPLHDMLNHTPNNNENNNANTNNQKKNIELFCVGDIRNMIGDEHFFHLLSSLQSSAIMKTMMEKRIIGKDDNNDNNERKNGNCNDEIDNIRNRLGRYSDKDILLVASTNINIGDELLISYRDCSKEVEEGHQIWLLLQYGFPFW